MGYLFLQLGYSLLFYSLFLFWSAVFPFNYREARNSGRTKQVFIFTLFITVTFPLTSVVLIKDGYYSSNFLFSLCTARNPTDYFIVNTLHHSLVAWASTCLFVIIIWKIFKVSSCSSNVSFHRFYMQDLILNNVGNNAKFGAAHQAEIKLLFVLVYFIASTITILILDSFTTSLTPNLYLSVLLPYFACESTGQGTNDDCHNLLARVQQPHLFNLSVATVVLLGLLPLVVFLFSADFKLVRRMTTICAKAKHSVTQVVS